jgi:hypothetical protein
MTITVEFGVCCDVKLVVAGFAFDMSFDGGRSFNNLLKVFVLLLNYFIFTVILENYQIN